jgi:hypothetical protein
MQSTPPGYTVITEYPGTQGRRRIRDTNSNYRHSSNLTRTANQSVSSSYDTDSYHTTNAHFLGYTKNLSNQSYYTQRDTPFQKKHRSNGTYNKDTQQGMLPPSRPRVSGRQLTTQNSTDHSYFLSNQYRNDDFRSDLETLNEWQRQDTFGTGIDKNFALDRLLYGRQQFQKGIQRFQMREKERPDLIHVAEGNETGPFGQRKYESWANKNNNGNDNSLELSSIYNASSLDGETFWMESKEKWQPQQQRQGIFESTDCGDRKAWNEHECEDTCYKSHHQKKHLEMNIPITRGLLSRRLSDITSESNSISGTHSPSNETGINRFKRMGYEKAALKHDQSYRARHIDSCETIFEQRTLSDRFDSFRPDLTNIAENGDQRKSSASSCIQFFDNQNEIDISGTPIRPSMHHSSNREAYGRQVDTQQMKSCGNSFGGGASTTNQFEIKFFDNLERQQISTTSPDTNYLKGTSFGNESIWAFFSGKR